MPEGTSRKYFFTKYMSYGITVHLRTLALYDKSFLRTEVRPECHVNLPDVKCRFQTPNFIW
jgi:hypothetical protein